MSLGPLIQYKRKNGNWIFYNIFTQSLIESSLALEETCNQLSSNDAEEILFGSNIEDTVEFNKRFLEKAQKEFFKDKNLLDKFIPESKIIISLWNECNFDCPYCYQHQDSYYDTHSKSLITLDINKVIELLKIKSGNGEFKPTLIGIIGGEPLLLNKDKINSITKLFGSINETFEDVNIQIATNGFNVHRFIPLFQKYQNINFTIKITIGYNHEQHKKTRILKGIPEFNTFERLEKNINKLQNKLPKSKVIIRINIDEDLEDINDVLKTMQYFEINYGIRNFEIVPVFELDKVGKITDSYLELLFNIMQDENLRKRVSIFSPLIIRGLFSILLDTQGEESKRPYLCNAYTFKETMEVYPQFTIQPCEKFNYFLTNQENIIKLKEEFSSYFDKNLKKECETCSHFRYCLSNICNLSKNISNDDCFIDSKELILRTLKLIDKVKEN